MKVSTAIDRTIRKSLQMFEVQIVERDESELFGPETVLAHGLGLVMPNEPVGYIYDIEVVEEHRGKGFGLRLLNALVREFGYRQIKLIFLHCEHKTEDFYERAGFKAGKDLVQMEFELDVPLEDNRGNRLVR